jgi:molybdopterin converting factor subunit 1
MPGEDISSTNCFADYTLLFYFGIMQLNILLFGITKEIVGQQKLSLEVPEEATVPVLMDQLRQQYPKLSELKSLMIAVNDEYAQEKQALQEWDEIALIPPVSGG